MCVEMINSIISVIYQHTDLCHLIDNMPVTGFVVVSGWYCYPCDRQAWMSLGDMSRSEAMSEFIKYIDQLCPLFMPYVDAHKAEKEEQLQKQ